MAVHSSRRHKAHIASVRSVLQTYASRLMYCSVAPLYLRSVLPQCRPLRTPVSIGPSAFLEIPTEPSSLPACTLTSSFRHCLPTFASYDLGRLLFLPLQYAYLLRHSSKRRSCSVSPPIVVRIARFLLFSPVSTAHVSCTATFRGSFAMYTPLFLCLFVSNYDLVRCRRFPWPDADNKVKPRHDSPVGPT